jgi:hypothetical protein
MKKIVVVGFLSASLLIATSFFVWVKPAWAEDNLSLVITEVSQNISGAGNEFVELYNYGSTDINLKEAGLKLKLLNSSGTSTQKSLVWTSTTIPAGGFFLFGSGALDGVLFDATYGGTLLTEKSGVIIADRDNNTVDALSWENLPANKSLERLPGNIEPNNNANFSLKDIPDPQNSFYEVADEEDNSNKPPDDTENSTDAFQDTPAVCVVTSSDIKLNEIFPYPASGEEFVEVVNTGADCVDVSGWKIMDEAGHKKEFPANSIIDPGEYLALEGNLYLNNDSDMVYLLDKNGNTKDDTLDYRFYEKAKKGFSYSFDGRSWQWTSSFTPGEKNIIAIANSEESADNTGSEENYSAAEKIYLNEIFPNPKDGPDNEYIEIASGESRPVDLFSWKIKDASKGKGYQFKEHTFLEPGEYLAVYKSQSKLALNNSEESVYLYNPRGDIISSVSYDKSRKNASYNFDGADWHWSKYLTPGRKNKFDSEPSVKIKKPKNVFKDTFAEFSAKARDKETKKLKYAWDFGDGKKSHLKKTFHKYLATGRYVVTLSVSDDSQTIEKSFSINVKNFPHPDLEIVKIIPNPDGNDSAGEAIDLKNNSGRKADLTGWKIATGSEEKTYNHPISDGVTLNPRETKAITREMSKFTLNNKAGKVQLVSPDGKIIDEVEYSKEKIAEGEIYAKTDGEWQWIFPPEKEESSEEEESKENSNEENNSDNNTGEILGATGENIPSHAPARTGYTLEDKFIFYKLFGLLDYRSQEVNYCPVNQLPPLFVFLK